MQSKQYDLPKVHSIDFNLHLLKDHIFLGQVGKQIQSHHIYIFKNMLTEKVARQLIHYLQGIGRYSFPAYYPLLAGCPDFHRVCQDDSRSIIKSKMHQFVFHPWNQNVLDLFQLMLPLYQLRNLISGFEENAFLSNSGADNYIARLAVHCYPSGGGYMQKHSDPVGEHQLAAVVMQLTEKGVDYHEGGLHIWQGDNCIDVDALMKPGDVVFFNAQSPHAVLPIDPNAQLDWLTFTGRWMLLAAVIKTAQNKKTADSQGY